MDLVKLALEYAGIKFIGIAEAQTPVVAEAHVGAEVEEVRVGEEWISADVAVSDSDLDIACDHEVDVGIHLRESAVENRQLRVEAEAHPGQRIPLDAIIDI